MGLIPMYIGIKKLTMYYKKKKETDPNSTKYKFTKNGSALSFINVAAVTFSNGGDNIGIYTPLFASNNIIGQIVILVVLFLIMDLLNSIVIAYRTANGLGLSRFLINLFSQKEPSGGYNSFPITHVRNLSPTCIGPKSVLRERYLSFEITRHIHLDLHQNIFDRNNRKPNLQYPPLLFSTFLSYRLGIILILTYPIK